MSLSFFALVYTFNSEKQRSSYFEHCLFNLPRAAHVATRCGGTFDPAATEQKYLDRWRVRKPGVCFQGCPSGVWLCFSIRRPLVIGGEGVPVPNLTFGIAMTRPRGATGFGAGLIDVSLSVCKILILKRSLTSGKRLEPSDVVCATSTCAIVCFI